MQNNVKKRASRVVVEDNLWATEAPAFTSVETRGTTRIRDSPKAKQVFLFQH